MSSDTPDERPVTAADYEQMVKVREFRERAAAEAAAMRQAQADGICYITPDGWCSTHSSGDGPVYCDADALGSRRGRP